MQSEQDFAGTASTYFTVDGLPVNERYGIWKDAIQSIFSVDADKQIREDDFRTTIESHLFGSLMLMEVHTRAQQWGRGYEQIAGNGMDHYGIGLYQEGTVYCEGAKGGKVLKPGGLMIYDLTQPFTAETSDLKNLNLVIPRSLVEDLLHQPDEHCMRFLEPSDPMVQIIRDMPRTPKHPEHGPHETVFPREPWFPGTQPASGGPGSGCLTIQALHMLCAIWRGL